jgi:flagellar export protein FliJ
MKKFKFTLQTVHQVRELKSERENLTLAELQQEADNAERRVEHIEALRNEAVENYMRRINSGEQLNALEMELNANHFASLNSLQKEAQSVADAKRRAAMQQLDVVRAARIEVKITDKLRDDQKKRHEVEFNRQEQQNIDELVTTKFARRIQGSK